ncbi:MAG: hypothetical protein WAT66_04385 [Actinomycetota bacterium]
MGFDQLLAFLAGFLLNMGGCAQPALDISPPPPAPQIEFALPIRAGINPPACPIGG